MQAQLSENTILQVETTEASRISYFQLFRYATFFDKCLIIFALTMTIISGISVTYSNIILNHMLEAMIMREPDDDDYDEDGSGETTTEPASTQAPEIEDKIFLAGSMADTLTLCKIAFVVFLLTSLGTTAMKIASYNQIFKIRQIYLAAALNQDLSYYDEKRDDLASKMGDTVTRLEEGINERVTNVVFSAAIVVTNIVTAFTQSWKLSAFSCIVFTAMVGLISYSVVVARRWCLREDEVMERAGRMADEVLSAILTVHAFGGKQKEIDRYEGYLQKAKRIFIKRELRVALLLGFGSFLFNFNYGLLPIFSIVLMKIENNPRPPYSYWMVHNMIYWSMFQAGLGIRGIAAVFKSVGVALGAGAEIFELVDKVPKINPSLDTGIKLQNCEGDIEFKDVKFNYPSRPDIPVLRGINLSMKRGQLVALVGQSGSGKSTIFQLISRFYDVDYGSVSLDGQDVRDLSVQWLRAQVGLVAAEPILFNCTVRENIRYGRESASDEQVEAAARQANAHYFITKLPKGYDTVVGERGASLSGGQKQRVAIARALVRDPRLLLLDEATSALDIASEAKWQKDLEKISENRTILIAANHLSMIRYVHLIYVLKQGLIVEYGSHDDLVEQKGYYYHMVKLQGIGINISKSKSLMRNIEEDDETNKSAVSDETTCTTGNASVGSLEVKPDTISKWEVLALNLPDWRQLGLGTLGSLIKSLGYPVLVLTMSESFQIFVGELDTMLIEALTCLGRLTLFSIMVGLAAFVQEYMFGCAGARLTHRLRGRMYEHLLTQDLAFFSRRNNSTDALCARMSGLTASIRRATGQSASYLVEGLLAIFFMFSISLIFEKRTTALLAVFLPLLFLGLYYQAKVTSNESSGINTSVEEGLEVAAEAVSNIGLVASLGCEQLVLRRHAALNAAARALSRRSALCCGLVTGASRAINILVIAAVSYYGGELMVLKYSDFDSIYTILFNMTIMESHYLNALLCTSEVMQGVVAARRILQGLRETPAIQDPLVPAKMLHKPTGEITLFNVYMTYPSQPSNQALKGLSLEIEAGKTYALAGANGAGKSTVIKLLMRFYDPDAGEVAFDGIPLPELRLADLRGSIGVVFEESILFEATIRDNIAYGDNTRDVPDAEIKEAAVQADIHSFVVTLPKGYKTMIGSKGTQLSTGQKQRVALARALVRKPTILLLDDATSMLDAESEQEVQAALDKAKQGRTVVTVTRSAAALLAADRVLVLHDGRLAEEGSHEELMAAHGLYYTLHKYL